VNVFGAAATGRALPGRLSKVRKIQLAKRHRKCGLARAKNPSFGVVMKCLLLMKQFLVADGARDVSGYVRTLRPSGPGFR
jgi:hypothetical protein